MMLAGICWLLAVLVGYWIGDSLEIPFVGTVNWFNVVLGAGAIALVLAISPFVMIPVAAAVSGLFLDQVAQAVEDRHYPHLPPARTVGILETLVDAGGFFVVFLLANLLALLLYLVFAPFAPVIFWGLNGYLLGREYFMIVAVRRMERQRALQIRSRHWTGIWAAGTLLAIPLSIPVVNLLVPILGTATFTHLFHRLTGQRAT